MPVRRLLPVLACGLVLVGCMTGERPTVTSEPTRSPDPAVEAVLALLAEDPPATPYTAVYDVLRKYGGATAEAVIAEDAGRWSLTVGDVRYLDIDGERSTCVLSRSDCTNGFDEARVSDILTTTGFARESAARRLRRAAGSALTITAAERTVAGITATCADLVVPGGTVVYCAVPQGLLALQDTGDVRLELTSLEDGADATAFDTRR